MSELVLDNPAIYIVEKDGKIVTIYSNEPDLQIEFIKHGDSLEEELKNSSEFTSFDIYPSR